MIHVLHSRLQKPSSPVRVVLIGVGGTGSKVLVGLKNLDLALRELQLGGLHVTAVDGDRVSNTNLIRQHFYPADVGRNKAEVLIERINFTCGVYWHARTGRLDAHIQECLEADVVISCVDSRKSRREISTWAQNGNCNWKYWMDFGNDRYTGQVVLGQPENFTNNHLPCRLPTAPELFPELIDTSVPDDDQPSCSAREALGRQDLFVNDAVCVAGMNVLWQLFFDRQLDFHGAVVNLKSGMTRSLKVDPVLWERLQGAKTVSAGEEKSETSRPAF